MKTLISLLPFMISIAQAAPSNEQGPMTSLALPALNFAVLVMVIIYFTRKPAANMFKQNADDVESLYKHAEEKDKEAQIRYAQFEQKMDNLDFETKRTLEQAERDAKKAQRQIEEETQTQLKKLDEDAVKKAEYEKNVLIQELNETLLDQVISKAKNNIKSDRNLQHQATTRLSSEVQS